MVGQTPRGVELFASHRRVVDQLLTDLVTQVFMRRQLLGDEIGIGQLADGPHAMDQHDLLEAFVDFGILDQAHERGKARTRGEHVQVAPRQQIVADQRAGGLAADHDLIADLEMLQTRRQRAVLHLDAKELEMIFVVGAGNRVGTHQRLAVDFQADHDELAILEPQATLARRPEAEQRIVPVMNAQHLFQGKLAHDPLLNLLTRTVITKKNKLVSE